MADEMTERDVMRDTLRHVYRVQHFLMVAHRELTERIAGHDRTKFGPDEFDAFVVATPKLKGLTYGSPEYKASLDSIRPAIDHHNAHNSHHPEHAFAQEQWADIAGYVGSCCVSDHGRVRSVSRVVERAGNQGNYLKGEIIRKAHKTPKGYLRVQLSENNVSKNWMVHRLVAQAFIPNPNNKPEVNHKNGIKTDNHYLNLEWVTASENLLHAYETELRKPAAKYVVYCDELEIRTVGCLAMEKELRAHGYAKASASAIWRCINEDGAKHLDLVFRSQMICDGEETSPIRGMNLVDLLEMICDWRAATERHADGDIRRSIEKNQERFGYSDDVKALLYNTVDLIEDYDRG